MVETGGRPLSVTVLICTFNRAALLARTLEYLARMAEPPGGWEALIVDNNSTDRTAETVAEASRSFPVALRYLQEPRQGKSFALNRGLSAITSGIVAFTDDDVEMSSEWLTQAAAPLLSDPSLDYTGGPVRAIWGAPRPRWLPAENCNLWGTIAVLDYGPAPFVFEDQGRVPIGANMAVRRASIVRAGLFNVTLGRAGRSLVGQEQAEFFCRTRQLGMRGLYVPAMALHHNVPASRLTRRYFRRWWYSKGISRARLHELHPQAEPGLDMRHVSRIAGVPRFALGELRRSSATWCGSVLLGDAIETAEREMMVAYSAGYALESWRLAHRSRDRQPDAVVFD